MFFVMIDSHYYIQQKKMWKLFFEKAFNLLYYAETHCPSVDHVT